MQNHGEKRIKSEFSRDFTYTFLYTLERRSLIIGLSFGFLSNFSLSPFRNIDHQGHRIQGVAKRIIH